MDSVSDSTGSQTAQERPSSSTSNPPVKAAEVSSDSTNYQGVLQPRGFQSLPPGWVSEWETFASSDQKLQLFGVLHRPQEWKGPRLLLVSHGMWEHGGRYLHVPHFVQSAVDAVYCLDHRGHGRSEGLRGHVDRFDIFAEDFALTIRRLDERLKKKFGRSEIYILGHSMGGLIVLRTLFLDSKLPVKVVSLSAPLLGVKAEVPFAKKMAAVVLSRVWGTIQMNNDLDPRDLSHDPEVVRTHGMDRLIHRKITPRLFTQMLAAIADTVERQSGLAYPVQMMLPSEDRLVDTDQSLGFFRSLKHRDKQLKSYPGYFHEILNEVGKEKVFEDLVAWLQQHQKPQA